jgi:hypothetical protein
VGPVMLVNGCADNPPDEMPIHARVPLHAIVLNEILALAQAQ